MHKNFLFALMCISSLVADRTTYQLLTTTHPDKISVQEIKEIPISGFDSQGHYITLYQTITNQKFLDLHEAVDIGVRFHNYAITIEALSKLQKLGKIVDISDSIIVVCDSLHALAKDKKWTHICASIVAVAAIPAWFITWRQGKRWVWVERYYGPPYHIPYEYYYSEPYACKASNTERFLLSSACLGIGGLLWWLGNHDFKSEVRKYLDVLQVLLNSPICVISDCKQVKKALVNIQDILVGREREIVTAYIQGLSLHEQLSFV